MFSVATRNVKSKVERFPPFQCISLNTVLVSKYMTISCSIKQNVKIILNGNPLMIVSQQIIICLQCSIIISMSVSMHCPLFIESSTHVKPSWRNRLARSAVNRKVGGSNPPGGGLLFASLFSRVNSMESLAFLHLLSFCVSECYVLPKTLKSFDEHCQEKIGLRNKESAIEKSMLCNAEIEGEQFFSPTNTSWLFPSKETTLLLNLCFFCSLSRLLYTGSKTCPEEKTEKEDTCFHQKQCFLTELSCFSAK